MVAGRRVGGEIDLKRGIVALTVSRPSVGSPPERAERAPASRPVLPIHPTAPAPPPVVAQPPPISRPPPAGVVTPTEPLEAAPPRRSVRRAAAGATLATLALLALGAVAAVQLAGSDEAEDSALDSATRSTLSIPTVAGIASPVSTTTRRTSTAARPTTRSTTSRATSATNRTTSRAAPAAATTTAAAPETTTTAPTSGTRLIAWRPRPGTTVYWFELYRQGSLGSRKILEAWLVEPRFTLPRRAPDGAALQPGLYSWSAAPQESPRGRIRYTGLTRAGRFELTADGRIVPRR